MKQINKQLLLTQVISKLENNLKVLVESAFEAKEASTNEESKAENKYDTRGLEASYLASGQSQRAKQLQEHIYLLSKVNLKNFTNQDSINVGALVQLLVDESKERHFFILPVGGVEVEFEGLKIQTITIEAPLGRSLHGMYEGDDFDLGKSSYEIQSLQ